MSDNSIEEKVRSIIVDQLGVESDKVTADAKFIEDLGADSLDTVELVMAFEENFDIEVPDEEAEKLQSVADVVAYIENVLVKLNCIKILYYKSGFPVQGKEAAFSWKAFPPFLP